MQNTKNILQPSPKERCFSIFHSWREFIFWSKFCQRGESQDHSLFFAGFRTKARYLWIKDGLIPFWTSQSKSLFMGLWANKKMTTSGNLFCVLHVNKIPVRLELYGIHSSPTSANFSAGLTDDLWSSKMQSLLHILYPLNKRVDRWTLMLAKFFQMAAKLTSRLNNLSQFLKMTVFRTAWPKWRALQISFPSLYYISGVFHVLFYSN